MKTSLTTRNGSNMEFLTLLSYLAPFYVPASPYTIEEEVYHGKFADEAQFPYVVHIHVPVEATFARVCSGVLVTLSWTLTASECVDYPIEANKIKVSVGAVHDDHPLSSKTVEQRIVPGKGEERNGMALLKTEPFPKNRRVEVALLNGDLKDRGRECFVVGYGRLMLPFVRGRHKPKDKSRLCWKRIQSPHECGREVEMCEDDITMSLAKLIVLAIALADLGTIRSRARWDTRWGRVPGVDQLAQVPPGEGSAVCVTSETSVRSVGGPVVCKGEVVLGVIVGRQEGLLRVTPVAQHLNWIKSHVPRIRSSAAMTPFSRRVTLPLVLAVLTGTIHVTTVTARASASASESLTALLGCLKHTHKQLIYNIPLASCSLRQQCKN
uniref:Peptidase S1 domain-containing protein n=1 Tax=Timema cristinae TaxID=61476 RepID=A0A7R9CX92_TIMCR|nr:unnamed protein product [Timema cristinae]